MFRVNTNCNLEMLHPLERNPVPELIVKWLDYPSILAFSKTCRSFAKASYEVRKKYVRQTLQLALNRDNKELYRKIIATYPDFLAEYPMLATIKYINEDFIRHIVTSKPELLNPNIVLKAVAYGSEEFVREMVTLQPELLLESSIIVTNFLGKKINGLTPLQAAISSGDVFMVRMMFETLTQTTAPNLDQGQYEDQDFLEMSYDRSVRERRIKIQKLSFNPWLTMQQQFSAIYPDGIDSVEHAQQTLAQNFKTAALNGIFVIINAATDAEIQYELNTPGKNNSGSMLNQELHNFRQRVSDTLNQEQIFNPLYLLKAFEIYYEKFNNFHGNQDGSDRLRNNRQMLFWRQVIGYIQRYLPAYYLQAFAQGMRCITLYHQSNLDRNFEFIVPCPLSNSIDDGLGYQYALHTHFKKQDCNNHASVTYNDFQCLLNMKTKFWNSLCVTIVDNLKKSHTLTI